MPMTYSPGRMTLGLLPEPEIRPAGFVASSIINLAILGSVLLIGMTAKQVIQQHYEMTELIIPNNPPPPVKVKQPPPPEDASATGDRPRCKLEERQIVMPKPKPEPKPVEMEAKVTLPAVKAKPQIVTLAPQPKSALTAAMPAQNNRA